MKTPSNCDNVIDSRDIIKAASDLQSERDDLKQTVEDRQEELDALGDCTDENKAEFDEISTALDEAEKALVEFDEDSDRGGLLKFAEEAEGEVSEWRDGATLIRRNYWVDYVKELLEDVGDLPKDLPHYIAIDWEKTADNIEADYSTIDFGGEEYLYRNC